MMVLLFGFYGQAIVKATLSVSLSSNTRSSIANNSSNTTRFHVAYEMLINDSHSLTHSYQDEIGKWLSKQYDNKTMILITDKYLPEFHKLVNRAQALQPTTAKYLQAKDLYVKSLQSEIESYAHFRNFLATGIKTEDDTSTQLLSNALKYEINSFVAFNNRTVSDTEQQQLWK